MAKAKKKIEHPNLFDYLNQIFYKKRTYEYNKKIVNGYLLSLWLSHDERLLELVHNIVGLLWYTPDDIIYKYYLYNVPRGKRFIRWTKKTPQDKKREKRLEKIIKKNPKLSKREAMMVLERIDNTNWGDAFFE